MNGPERIMYCETVTDPIARGMVFLLIVALLLLGWRRKPITMNWLLFGGLALIGLYWWWRYEFIMTAYRP